jgi:hypothetical protein
LTHSVYKIEIREPVGGALLYSFGNTSTDNTEVSQWQTKDVLTDGVGYFVFTIPTKKGVQEKYQYYDIDLMDTVKIFHDRATVPATANFIGKIYDISAPLSTDSGYVRIISGLNFGEVLLRRIKKNRIWTGTDTDVIVTELANDLSILHAADIGDENSHPSITCASETYFDLLRKLSDNWVGGVNINFDFFVDVDTHLHWKQRPIRTVGVPTFTIGENILNYKVSRSVTPVRNNITVYGQSGDVGIPGLDGRCDPTNKDSWTVDDIANWHLTAGDAVISDAAGSMVGANHIRGDTTVAPFTVTFHRHFSTPYVMFGNTAYQTLNFYMKTGLGSAPVETVRLWAPDNANYYEVTVGLGINSGWILKQYQLGENQTYDATYKPTAYWVPHGSPNWDDIEGIEFYYDCGDQTSIHIDALYFGHGRFRDTASDLVGAGSSGVLYGQRDLEITDNTLRSDTECEQRSEAMLYQMKTPPVQIEVTKKPGDNNILIGDRVPMTIPAENISVVDYDIFMVEHDQKPEPEGYSSKATMVNSASIREPVEASLHRSLAMLKVQVRRIAADVLRLG